MGYRADITAQLDALERKFEESCTGHAAVFTDGKGTTTLDAPIKSPEIKTPHDELLSFAVRTAHLPDVIQYLNGLLESDRDAMSLLFNAQVTCNRSMCDHPRIPIPVPIREYVQGTYTTGGLTPLALINGMFDLMPGNLGRISVVYTLECTNRCFVDNPGEVLPPVTIHDDCPFKCGGQVVRDKIVRFEETKGPIRERA